MWYLFDPFRSLTLSSIFIRMLLAVLCGGIIGIEREFKRRPAGFRTHILICLGAAMTTLTSQYISFELLYHTDIARLGAQVVAGIGFIGAGTIIVTGHQRVKGLTTAAGLWTTAIIGLSIGSGFYEGGIIVTLLILSAELLLIKLEYRIFSNTPEVNLYIEYAHHAGIDGVLKCCLDNGVKVRNMQITTPTKNPNHNNCAILSVRLHKKIKTEKLINNILTIDGVVLIEEL